MLSGIVEGASASYSKSFTVEEVKVVIKDQIPKKAGYDFITNQVLQKLSEKGIKCIIQLCNRVLRWVFLSDSFPSQ